MKIDTRRFFRKLLRNSGFQRRLNPDFVDVMNEQNINLVLDVGANDGGYGREIRDRGYKGLIISFEPNPVAFKRLMRSIKYDNNWLAFEYALGESNGNAEFIIAENDVMSSFKDVTEFGNSKDTRIVKKTNIQIGTVDDFLINN